MYKNIILDVDGTIWNTTELVANAWNHAISENGKSNVRVDADILKTQFGKPMNVIAANLFTDVTEEIREQLLAACCKEEQRCLAENTADLSYPNIRETIRRLKEEKGCRLFIVSNCQTGYIELVIEKNHLKNDIEDYECFGSTKKQKSENILLICERNHLKKEETVYVGDTRGDFEASISAGISFIHADYGFESVDESAVQISDFSELIDLVG